MSNQLVRRNNNSQRNRQLVRTGAAAGAVMAPLGLAAAQALVNSNGLAWVVDQIGRGAIRVSKGVYGQLFGSSVTSNQISAAPAPAALGAFISGSAKYNGDIRIKHRELISTLTNVLSSHRVNPADGATFPYLSKIAFLYDKYKIHGLKFSLVSSSGSNSPGRWYLAWDPDSQDVHADSTQELMAIRNSLSATTWQSGCITCETMDDFRYTSFLPDAVKDWGQVLFTSSGMSGGEVFDLYVEYDITLRDPEVGSVVQSTSTLAFPTAGTAVLLGPNFTTAIPSKNQLKVAPGVWQVTQVVTGTGGSFGNPVFRGGTAVGKYNILNFGATNTIKVMVVRSFTEVVLDFTDAWGVVGSQQTTFTPINLAHYNAYTGAAIATV